MKNNSFYIIIALLIGGGITYLVLNKEPEQNPIDPVGGPPRGVLEAGTFKDFTGTNVLLSTTTDATSTPVYVLGAKKITWVFGQGSDGAAASLTTFFVEVSLTDPEVTNGIAQQGSTGLNQDFIVYNRLIDNVTNSISQDLTRVGEITSAIATSTFTMDLSQDAYKYVRCIAAVQTIDSGNASSTCGAIIHW